MCVALAVAGSCRLRKRPSTRTSVNGGEGTRNLTPLQQQTHGFPFPRPVALWSLGAWAVEDHRLSELLSKLLPQFWLCRALRAGVRLIVDLQSVLLFCRI